MRGDISLPLYLHQLYLSAFATTASVTKTSPANIPANNLHLRLDLSIMKSNLDLLNECDSFPYPSSPLYVSLTSSYYRLMHGSDTISYLPPLTISALKSLTHSRFSFHLQISDSSRTVTLTGATASARSAAVAEIGQHWREQGTFKILQGWRDELHPVYAPRAELCFAIEWSVSPIFGVTTYGIHMMAHTVMDGEVKLWIPRWARTKQTYSGMLGNTVAGSIRVGEKAFECLVRKAVEEACLPEKLVRQGARSVGAVTYFNVRDARAGGETGFLEPECQYIYDIELPQEVRPKPNDEVEEFYLWGIEETMRAMAKGEFKPNSAVILLDWLIRNGVLTPENEPNFIEIVSRLHRRLEFPTA